MPPFRDDDPPFPGLVDRWMVDPDAQAPLPMQAPAPMPAIVPMPIPAPVQAQSGKRCGFLQLPQKPAGDGYYTYGTPGRGAGQYGVPDTISLIQDVAKNWSGTPFGVGNISRAGGGKFGVHKSHRDGTNVDIRPMRSDGAPVGANWRLPGYDRAATQRLVDAFLATGRVRNILFNDPAIKGVMPYPDHNDHFHVNVRSSCTKR